MQLNSLFAGFSESKQTKNHGKKEIVKISLLIGYSSYIYTYVCVAQKKYTSGIYIYISVSYTHLTLPTNREV